jgi:tetratricopeptide (TPR) repeat protein
MKILVVLVSIIAAAYAEQLRISVHDHTHGAPSSVGPPIRDKATNEACLVTSTEMAEGKNLVSAGRLVEGRAKLESALAGLERAGAPDSISHACLMNAIGFVELQQRRADLAIEWFQRALELKPRSGALLARLTTNLASAYSDLKQVDHAEGLARRASTFPSAHSVQTIRKRCFRRRYWRPFI